MYLYNKSYKVLHIKRKHDGNSKIYVDRIENKILTKQTQQKQQFILIN